MLEELARVRYIVCQIFSGQGLVDLSFVFTAEIIRRKKNTECQKRCSIA